MTIDEEMREYDRQVERSVERILAASPHCPKHGSPFIAGLGIGDKFYPALAGGECPICLRERYGL